MTASSAGALTASAAGANVHSQFTASRDTSAQITATANEYTQLQSEYTMLSTQLESRGSLRSLEEYATTQLGMSKLDQDQVVYLDGREFKSTWLGNKSVYRTRMAIADGGELIVLAPGVSKFGEDAQVDKLIRKYGYRGRIHTLEEFEKPENQDLRDNMGAAAHLRVIFLASSSRRVRA